MSFCSKGLFVLLLVVVVAHVSSVIYSIELPPKRGSSKVSFVAGPCRRADAAGAVLQAAVRVTNNY